MMIETTYRFGNCLTHDEDLFVKIRGICKK